MSDDEFAAAGGNQSGLHLDFVPGCQEMDVDGLTNEGAAEPVMRDGERAFAV